MGVKNLPANAENTREVNSILDLEDPLKLGNGIPLQYSCLENSMDRGAQGDTAPEVAKTGTQLRG